MRIDSLSPAQFDAAVELWLAARDVPKIDLMVRSENDAALAFYEAIGYGRDEVVVMSKRLRWGARARRSPSSPRPIRGAGSAWKRCGNGLPTRQ